MKETIKAILGGFDLESILPDLGEIFSGMGPLLRILVLAGPVCLLVMGLLYWFAPAPEANYSHGYRCYYGMGSVQAWRFTQQVAGMVFMALGLVLTILMVVRCWNFGNMSGYDMAVSALWSLVWELVLVLLGMLGINITAMVCFDGKGNRREKKA